MLGATGATGRLFLEQVLGPGQNIFACTVHPFIYPGNGSHLTLQPDEKLEIETGTPSVRSNSLSRRDEVQWLKTEGSLIVR